MSFILVLAFQSLKQFSIFGPHPLIPFTIPLVLQIRGRYATIRTVATKLSDFPRLVTRFEVRAFSK